MMWRQYLQWSGVKSIASKSLDKVKQAAQSSMKMGMKKTNSGFSRAALSFWALFFTALILSFNGLAYYFIFKELMKLKEFVAHDYWAAGSVLLIINLFSICMLAWHYHQMVTEEKMNRKRKAVRDMEEKREQEALQFEQQKIESQQSWKNALQVKSCTKRPLL